MKSKLLVQVKVLPFFFALLFVQASFSQKSSSGRSSEKEKSSYYRIPSDLAPAEAKQVIHELKEAGHDPRYSYREEKGELVLKFPEPVELVSIEECIEAEELHTRAEGESSSRRKRAASRKKRGELPEDFPRRSDHPEGEAGQRAYERAKSKWIEENPEAYRALFDDEADPEQLEEKERKKSRRKER